MNNNKYDIDYNKTYSQYKTEKENNQILEQIQDILNKSEFENGVHTNVFMLLYFKCFSLPLRDRLISQGFRYDWILQAPSGDTYYIFQRIGNLNEIVRQYNIDCAIAKMKSRIESESEDIEEDATLLYEE